MKNTIFIALIILTLSRGLSNSQAAEHACGNVRLDQPPHSMAHVYVRDQGPFRDCYAAAAAQMIDAYRFSHGDTRYNLATSTLMAATQNARDEFFPKLQISHGDTCSCIGTVAKHGGCSALAENLSDGSWPDYYMFHYQMWADELEKANAVAVKDNIDFLVYLTGQPPEYDSEKELENEKRYNRLLEQYAQNVCKDLTKTTIQKKSMPSVQFIEEFLAADNSAGLIEFLLAKLCTGANHFEVKLPSCGEHIFNRVIPDVSGHERQISGLLNQPNAQPLAIKYCSAVLRKGSSYEGNPLNFPLGMGKEAKDCGLHESLIIGERKSPKTGHCQYLVRNTWGVSCNQGYAKEWDCESGSIWIDQDALTKNIYSLSYFN